MGTAWSRCLPASVATALLAAAPLRAREGTEWVTAYWYNANENNLPRVLLIGDSICSGYQSTVKDELAGVAYVSYYATSKCVTDRSYLKELGYILEEYDYAAIHFNNGLHSLGADRAAWATGLRAALDLLQAKGKGAKLIWATSTPLKDPALTERARELNAIAAPIVAERHLPVDDLFTLLDPLDRATYWTDTFHHNPEARQREGKQVAASLRAVLGPAVTAAAPAAPAPAVPAPAGTPAGTPAAPIVNPGFEAADGWGVYPFDRPADCAVEYRTDGAHGGAKAARVAAGAAGAQFFQYRPGFAAGATYRLGVWVRAEQPGRLTVHVRTTRPPYKSYGAKTVDVGTEWQQVETTLDVPADYQPADHALFFEFPKPGVYWLDDVTAERP